jgi:hypothetical protein
MNKTSDNVTTLAQLVQRWEQTFNPNGSLRDIKGWYDLKPWGSYDEWRALYPTARFEFHNQQMHVEEGFRDLDSLIALRPSSPYDEQRNEIWFDTFRINTEGWSKRELVQFVNSICADELTYDEQTALLEVWFD